MREHGILFKAEMVRAILDGRKTQTRRAFKHGTLADLRRNGDPIRRCPYGQPGDRLWVRETWAPHADEEETYRNHQRSRAGKGSISEPGSIRPQVFYRADGGDPHIARWRPSLLMPRWASRITLEVVSVMLDRGPISADEARREGFESPAAFASLYEEINGAGSLEKWRWRIEFRRVP